MYNAFLTFMFAAFIVNFAFDVIEGLCAAVQFNFRLKKGNADGISALPRKWKLF